MVRRRQRERSVWEVVLPDGDRLWPAALRRIDELLDDEALIEGVAQALETRWPQSRRCGRQGTPAEVVLRMLVLKHLYGWSYDTLEQEVRANLVYRAFARVGCDVVPDAKTILRIARVLPPEVIHALHRRVVEMAIAAKVVTGRRLRVDTTVVETNVHYPTDSALLVDGVRVLTRTLRRVGATIGEGRRRVRNRLRSAWRRAFAISRLARSATTRPALTRTYRRLLATTRAVLRDTDRVRRRLQRWLPRARGARRRRLLRWRTTLAQLVPLVRRVAAQTSQRIDGGDRHVADKVVSLFEPHTEVIRKGKVAKPTEFGKLVTIQEAEHQIVTAYTVHPRRPADATLWVPALETHQALFGRAPDLAAADRGFSSARNEAAAAARGVRRIVLPHPGPRSPARRAHEQQRWFRRGQRWRVGSEGRISVLKRRHALRRCLYHGPAGTHRWVGLGVIAANLLTLAAASP
jgi:IS5 family transposase